ncbi:hypothetical protein LGL08_20030 [Clostridium estertheticum]|nr:hypothetical protein [Clostridium estertheticum]MCB2308994.1 hypothetical protein [Clostridium estertheticum]MCB2346872.1 hypothetical protein [Clostridium estertheticum]MCB2351816.1 hypothetical protein [Clostridium estertheticum]WAG48420.1 hypothetical protein LL127_22835 [Clostridium estertheticum]
MKKCNKLKNSKIASKVVIPMARACFKSVTVTIQNSLKGVQIWLESI